MGLFRGFTRLVTALGAAIAVPLMGAFMATIMLLADPPRDGPLDKEAKRRHEEREAEIARRKAFVGPLPSLPIATFSYAREHVVSYLNRLKRIRGLEDLSFPVAEVWQAGPGAFGLGDPALCLGTGTPPGFFALVYEIEKPDSAAHDGASEKILLSVEGHKGLDDAFYFDVATVKGVTPETRTKDVVGLDEALSSIAAQTLAWTGQQRLPRRPLGARKGAQLADIRRTCG
jgi:hypothetical protein